MPEFLEIDGRAFRIGGWFAAKSGSNRIRRLLELDTYNAESGPVVWYENLRGECGWLSFAAWGRWAGEEVPTPSGYKPQPHRRLPRDHYTRRGVERR